MDNHILSVNSRCRIWVELLPLFKVNRYHMEYRVPLHILGIRIGKYYIWKEVTKAWFNSPFDTKQQLIDRMIEVAHDRRIGRRIPRLFPSN